jgi:hypothetical protein
MRVPRLKLNFEANQSLARMVHSRWLGVGHQEVSMPTLKPR